MSSKMSSKISNRMQNRISNKKTKKNGGNKNGGNKNGANKYVGGGAPGAAPGAAANNSTIDLSTLTEEEIKALMAEGISLQELKSMGGTTVSPILEAMIAQQGPVQEQAMVSGPGKPLSNKKKFPAMMNLKEYSEYQKQQEKEDEEKQALLRGNITESNISKSSGNKNSNKSKDKSNIYGYQFSNLMTEETLRDMRKLQGSFLIGVNLANLFNQFKSVISNDNKKIKEEPPLKLNPDRMLGRLGEWIDVNFENTLIRKMGYRNSEVPLLPEVSISDYSTFNEVLEESKKYADMGFNGKITPYGLLIMTRMLYKYKKNISQWIRVATILELIYKYLGSGQTREEFFKNKDDISIMALMELEEFYNTDHIFMSNDELINFKKDLDFYKHNLKIDINKKLNELRNRPDPPI
uniref:Uncharacterized protein n=1 Tax=viral metagenome TaxID=1070528 RepID=A0A6C0EY95_9ZZZZ